MKIRITEFEGRKTFQFYCPGCKSPHALNDTWRFNDDPDHPTFDPSILVTNPRPINGKWERITYRCHTFIRNGQIEFLADCSHDLAGTTVDLPDYPDKWL